MLRKCLTILLLLPAILQAAEPMSSPYLGRSVAAIIDSYRSAGYPFAYSTGLLPDDLLVTAEPEATDPVDLVREILAPHSLTLRLEAGVQLVVRTDQSALQRGSILLNVAERDSDQSVVNANVTVTPELPISREVSSGAFLYTRVPPGKYKFTVTASGMRPVDRIVNIFPGEKEVVNIGVAKSRSEIETITISASRYEISRDIASSKFLLDQRSIQNMPDIGADPIRITQRLPGAAASGASARTHFRGGEEREIGVMLNGQWLFDPYHVRDYQSIFSAIDARAITGVEVYTGGFPAQYGDRMSGLVLMESMEAIQDRYTEVGLSVFNTSILTSGVEADKRWVFSARRGNLDLVIDPKFGEPSYFDVFGEVALDLTPNTTLSFNALFANDRVRLVLESDPNEFEQVVSKTENAQFWMQLKSQWSDSLSSNMVLSVLAYENLRVGFTDDIEKIVSSVRDDRQIDQVSLRQDWSWKSTDSHLLQWGFQANYSDAIYDYSGSAEYFSLQSLYENQPDTVIRAASAAPRGGNFALYVSDRWRLTPRTTFEWGLRWDDQTYTNLASDAQLSPRFNILHALTPKTELRFSWGRYHQSQRIQELQIEDGITNFWPAQRSDHVIAGIRHLFGDDVSLRVELFHKDLSRVRPRFENLYNPLGIIPELQPDRVGLNPDSAQSSGIEISIDRSSGDWNWWGSYTLSEVTDRIDGRDVARSWDQRHAFQGGLSWTNESWTAAVAASVHSGWPVTDLSAQQIGVDVDGEPIIVVTPGLRNEQNHPTFASVDMRVSRAFDLRRGSLMAFVEISNVLDRRNLCCLDWDSDTDANGNFVLERGIDYWLPMLPAVGILWEF